MDSGSENPLTNTYLFVRGFVSITAMWTAAEPNCPPAAPPLLDQLLLGQLLDVLQRSIHRNFILHKRFDLLIGRFVEGCIKNLSAHP